MKTIFFLSISLMVIILIACNSSSQRNKDIGNIKKMEEQTYSPKIVRLDPKLANELILAYEDFGKKYPQDSMASNYLFKAGEVAMSLNMGKKAIDYFSKFLSTYPNARKAPHSLFLQGFVYETQLKNLDLAKQKYVEFLNKYPNHELAKDVFASIEMLGKSPEEIIKGFEEKNKQAAIKK